MNKLNLYREILLVDEILSKMEKYTVQLEELVAQRTAALQEEKKKADILLYRLLPAYASQSCLIVLTEQNHTTFRI